MIRKANGLRFIWSRPRDRCVPQRCYETSWSLQNSAGSFKAPWTCKWTTYLFLHKADAGAHSTLTTAFQPLFCPPHFTTAMGNGPEFSTEPGELGGIWKGLLPQTIPQSFAGSQSILKIKILQENRELVSFHPRLWSNPFAECGFYLGLQFTQIHSPRTHRH